MPPAELIQAIREHQPDIVGLSGLLVKSAEQMVVTAEELTAAGIVPADAGGRRGAFQRLYPPRIAPAYGNLVAYAVDAMKGLGAGQPDHGSRQRREELSRGSRKRPR